MRAISTGCLLTLTVLASAGCHKNRPVALNDALSSPSVFVTLDNKTTFLLYTPKVYGDKLTGWVDGKYTEYPTSHVKQVQVREPDRAATAALVALGVAGAVTIVYMIVGSASSEDSPPDCDLDPNDPRCT